MRIVAFSPATMMNEGSAVEALRALIATEKLEVVELRRSDGREILVIGDPTTLRPPGLHASLFGDHGRVRVLFMSLDGQLLPQSWSQGTQTCVVSRWSRYVFGAFHSRAEDPVTAYYTNRRIGQRLAAIVQVYEASLEANER